MVTLRPLPRIAHRLTAIATAGMLITAPQAFASDPLTHWVLYQINVSGTDDKMERLGLYTSMYDCFDAWTDVEETLPKPKIDVQIICVRVSGLNPAS